jgi:hypothetical protein
MNQLEVFQALLQQLATNKDVIIGWEQVKQAVSILNSGLLKPASPATMIECNACHEQCLMPVHVLAAQNGKTGRAFVVCDKRNDMGRIKVDLARLAQWHTTQAQLALWTAQQLNIKTNPVIDKATGSYKLGSVQGKKRLAQLELSFTDNILLKTAGHQLPLIEAIEFIETTPTIDLLMVQQLVDLPPVIEKAARYNPSIARREANKLDTQAMYQDWQKAYRKLKKEHPTKSDSWISKQIAKMEVAQKRSAGTIKKKMLI